MQRMISQLLKVGWFIFIVVYSSTFSGWWGSSILQSEYVVRISCEVHERHACLGSSPDPRVAFVDGSTEHCLPV
jgi:hypothetical protein